MAQERTLILGGVECDYDPETRIALVYCANCSERNEVEVWLADDGRPEYAGRLTGRLVDRAGCRATPGERPGFATKR